MEITNTPKRKKDVCLWLVDSNARVRKYRLTYFRINLFAGFFTLLGAVLFLVAGDYTRIQVLRFKNFLLLQKLEYEKSSLENTNSKLESMVPDLKDQNSKVLAYEQEVKDKLFEMSKVIESATTLDVLEEDSNSESAPSLEEGMGGAEIDISSWSDVGLRGRLDPNLIISQQQLAMLPGLTNKGSFLPQEGLPEKIERYIKLIKELPLKSPANGKLTSSFGQRISPFTRRLSFHEGIDISLDRGTSVFAASKGIVKSIEHNSTYGLMVDIQHNSRLTTRYAHLNRVLVKENEAVSSGELLGLSGSSGRSTGPHLHYEVRIDGKAANPKNFLKLLANLQQVF